MTPPNDEVQALVHEVASLRKTLHEEKEAKRTSTRRMRWAVFLFGAFTLVSIGTALWARDAASTAQDTADQLLEQRTEARMATCEKDKKFADAHNRLVLGIVTRAGQRPVPPELQGQVDEQIVAVPDCTPEGVESFYERQASTTTTIKETP